MYSAVLWTLGRGQGRDAVCEGPRGCRRVQPGGMEGPRAGDIYSWAEGKAGESAEIWTLDWSEAGGRGRKVPSAEPAPEV